MIHTPSDQNDFSPEEFLAKMDAGEFDVDFSAALNKLTPDQLAEVSQILLDRDGRVG